MAKKEDQSIRCSFCGKRETQVERLIAGPGVYICSECVQACTELLSDNSMVDNRVSFVSRSTCPRQWKSRNTWTAISLVRTRPRYLLP